MSARIIDINEKNIKEYSLFCKKSQKKEVGYQNKVKWIKERLKEGLRYKLLLVKEGEKETSKNSENLAITSEMLELSKLPSLGSVV